MAYPSYARFVADVVLPRRARNPQHIRLDGEVAGGNFGIAGTFRHDGREWKVHEDSHYEPLLIAYDAIKSGDPSPFVEEPTKRRTSLNLKPELRAKMSNRRHKYVYIYSV